MSYDIRFRKRTIEYHEEGNSIRATAKTFGISPNTLNAWLQKYRQNGELERKYRNYESKISEDAMLEYLGERPDAYQSEMAEHFSSSQSTIHRTMKRHNITRKKRKSDIQSNAPKE